MSTKTKMKPVEAPKLIKKANRLMLQLDGLTAKEALFVLLVMSDSVIGCGWRDKNHQIETVDQFCDSIKANLARRHTEGKMTQ